MEYEIQRKPFRRGMRLSVQRDGKVRVLAPLTVPVRLIERFVFENLQWIEQQKLRWVEYHAKHPRRELMAGARIHFLGQARQLVFENELRKSPTVEAIENYIIVRGAELSPEVARLALKRFYDKQARLHLPERVEYFAKKMLLRPAALSFRAQKTRWGSCSSTGHISLNYKMMIAPEAVVDYVVIHELAHLQHANHSRNFWKLVEAHDARFDEHRRWLRANQHEAEFLDL